MKSINDADHAIVGDSFVMDLYEFMVTKDKRRFDIEKSWVWKLLCDGWSS